MSKIFRKARRAVFDNGKFTKYFAYAFGEILIVAIGILIAVYLNNLNDERKEEARFRVVLEGIVNDLQSDLETLSDIIPRYEGLDSLIIDVLMNKPSEDFIDTIDSTNVNECIPCQPLHLRIIGFYAKKDSYLALKGLEEVRYRESSIQRKVLTFYNKGLESLSAIDNELMDLTLQNVIDLEEKEWYLTLLTERFSKDRVAYFLYSQEYRNRLLTFKIIAIDNFLANLQEYKKGADNLIEEIEEYLKSN